MSDFNRVSQDLSINARLPGGDMVRRDGRGPDVDELRRQAAGLSIRELAAALLGTLLVSAMSLGGWPPVPVDAALPATASSNERTSDLPDRFVPPQVDAAGESAPTL